MSSTTARRSFQIQQFAPQPRHGDAVDAAQRLSPGDLKDESVIKEEGLAPISLLQRGVTQTNSIDLEAIGRRLRRFCSCVQLEWQGLTPWSAKISSEIEEDVRDQPAIKVSGAVI